MKCEHTHVPSCCNSPTPPWPSLCAAPPPLQLLCAALEEGELRLFFCEASALRTVRFSSAKAELNKAYVGLLFFVGLHDT